MTTIIFNLYYNKSIYTMNLCTSDVVPGMIVLLSEKNIVSILFIRLREMGHCFMWSSSSFPHSCNRLVAPSLQVSLKNLQLT